MQIDLRSDTVTVPDEGMYRAMREAPLGDDVFEDDPTTRRLEERAAEVLGKEASLFVPSGTMGNSIAIAVLSRPGDEVLVEAAAHSFNFEVGGGARLWGAQLRPLESERGQVPLAKIRGALRPIDVHLPRSRLLILEQTNNLAGGSVLPLEYLRAVQTVCRENDLAFHIDGARIFNASVAAGVPVSDYAGCADSVMFCFSKGLGAPVGSVISGSTDFVREARRVRKLLGGGLRQSGVLAACGLYALEHNVNRLAEDHAHARALAEAISEAISQASSQETEDTVLPGFEVVPPETNMVYLRRGDDSTVDCQSLTAAIGRAGVLAVSILGQAVRFVFHRGISSEDAAEANRRIIEALLTFREA